MKPLLSIVSLHVFALNYRSESLVASEGSQKFLWGHSVKKIFYLGSVRNVGCPWRSGHTCRCLPVCVPPCVRACVRACSCVNVSSSVTTKVIPTSCMLRSRVFCSIRTSCGSFVTHTKVPHTGSGVMQWQGRGETREMCGPMMVSLENRSNLPVFGAGADK